MLVLLHAHAVALTPCRCPQIFATTRKEDAADDGGKRKAGSAPKSGGGGGAGPAKKFKPYSKKMQDAAELEKQQFRDRAKERRLGTSKEYQISEETVRSLTVEESKYLGGDMEHTHLVKGLDFALLAKVRSEMDMKEEKRDEQLDKALEDALTDFSGCAVVISHDRFFLDRICTHILAFEGDAHVEWFEGNFEDYEEDKKRRLGDDADQPHRIKYKPLTRD